MFHIELYHCFLSHWGIHWVSTNQAVYLSNHPLLFFKKKCIENILCQKHHYYVPRIGPTSLPPAKYHLPILGMKQMSRILCFSHAHFRSPTISSAQPPACIPSLVTPTLSTLKLWSCVWNSLPAGLSLSLFLPTKHYPLSDLFRA